MLTSSALHLGSTSPESEQAATDKGAKVRPYSSCALHKMLTSCLPSVLLPGLGLQLCTAGTSPAGAKASKRVAVCLVDTLQHYIYVNMPHGYSSLRRKKERSGDKHTPKVISCVIVIDRLAGAGRLKLEAALEGRAELGGHLVHCSPERPAGRPTSSSSTLQPKAHASPATWPFCSLSFLMMLHSLAAAGLLLYGTADCN